MTDCTLCSEIHRKFEKIPEDYREIVSSNKNLLWDSRNLVLLPSFGPLNRTHAMVVPKTHANSFAALDCEYKVEVREFLEKLQVKFKKTFNSSLVFFESGAGNISNHSGGCITHAHIHCVISNEGFERRLFEEVDLKKMSASEETELDTQLGYIWFKGPDGGEYAKNNPLLPSQFLRYLYMENSSTPQKWNWRRDIDIEGIHGVITTYSRVFT